MTIDSGRERKGGSEEGRRRRKNEVGRERERGL